MSLTRSFLKGMGLTDEQVGAIIEEHTTVTDALKKQRDDYKNDAEKLAKVQKELDDLKANGGDWEKKYNDEHKAFEDFKKDTAEKEISAKIRTAYRALLKENNVGEKHIESILKVTDFSKIKLDKEGKLENSEKLAESIKSDWDGFITTTESKGANVETPPSGSKGKMTKEEIMKIKDTTERQKAIAENHELFDF